MISTELWKGALAALPIAVAYLPVSFAFGAAASGLGLGQFEATGISALMFSGANQVFLIGAIESGLNPLLTIAICIAVSLRHLLYGWVLNDSITRNRAARSAFAFGLTDEVFGRTLAARSTGPERFVPGWLVGLVFVAWATWVGGTLLGISVGELLGAIRPDLAKALEFALPALFIGLVFASASRALLRPMLVAAGVAVAFVLADLSEVAIPVGALIGVLARRRG
ncbi:MAG: branched-chain amino acid ABC transporter permease [Inquilinus sp.]|nr:branched-chain amino acid ABC transporter permease [Inquilinus sp.]